MEVSYFVPVTIFIVLLVVMVAWNLMQSRLSDEQREAMGGSPLLQLLVGLVLVLLIFGMAMKIAHDLGW